MSLIDSLFGPGAAGSMLSRTDMDQIDNQFDSVYNTYVAQQAFGNQPAAQQASAFNQKLNNWNRNPFAQTAVWMFAGKSCTITEFADLIWPGEHEDKLVFLLTHSGPEIK